MLVWPDLSDNLREAIKRVAAVEADRIAAKPPKDYHPGDTGAEENGWDSHAPAVALGLDPNHPHAKDWWHALKVYAVNTYSIKADQTSNATIGTDHLKDLVTTANLFDDFTLDNHHIFHPDYVQVCGQELGESLMILELANLLAPSDFPKDFRSYATHHAQQVWQQIMRPLTLPDGEFARPNGTDWTLHTSQTPSYPAYVTTLFADPIAFVAESRLLEHARRRRALSPPGRILGDTNLEWFWEPILIKRCCTALLQHALRPTQSSLSAAPQLDRMVEQRYWPDAKIWLRRNPNYFVSAAWGNRRMGTFIPLGDNYLKNPYCTLPLDGILPTQVTAFESQTDLPNSYVLTMSLTDGRRCALICFDNSVLWISPIPFRHLPIQNDKLSGGIRQITAEGASARVTAMAGDAPFPLKDWANIDNRLGLISPEGFRYTPGKGYKMRSVAYDTIAPVAPYGAWQMIPDVSSNQSRELARMFHAELSEPKAIVTLQDGPAGKRFRIQISLGKKGAATQPANVAVEEIQ
jgi:hypothetical protein